MNSQFSLSFGYALVIVGIFNIFFRTNEIILVGVSISAFVFSIINMRLVNVEDEKYEIFYTLPFIILLVFSCYSEELARCNIINWIEKNNLSSILTFLSFGMFFIIEYRNSYKKNLEEVNRRLSIVEETIDYTELIVNECKKYNTKRKNNPNQAIQEFINKIENICREKSESAKVELNLLKEKIK